MPSTELTHVFRIAAPPREVYDHLREPEHYIGLSPLVVAVRDVRRDGDGTVRYTAVERFRFLGLRHDNAIDVTISADPAALPDAAGISGEVRSPGRVRMDYRFAIAGDGAGSVVTDVLHLRTPPGLLRFAASQAGAVQRARAAVLAERLARGA